MTTEWTVSVEVVRQWRWRCLADGALVPGFDLYLANPESGRLGPLPKGDLDPVQRHDLRHNCGGLVTPVTPLKAE
jgi:hypothetical protein